MEKPMTLPQWTRMPAQCLAPDPQAVAYLRSLHEDIVAEIDNDGATSPKYGVLTEDARVTPMLAFGSPSLKKLHSLGFTDGESIFVSDDLLRAIAMEDATMTGAGPTPLAFLLQIRAMLRHSTRLREFPEEIAQVAGETSAYAKARCGFPNMKWPKAVESRIAASALPPADIERYSMMAEETIAREIMAAIDKRDGSGASATPTDDQVKAGLTDLGFAPILCALRAIDDPHVISRAVAEDERQELLRVSAKPPSLLAIAAERGDHAAAAALLSVCDPMERGADGHTPLMVACAHGHAECALAIAERSDLSQVDGQGRSAAEIARQAGAANLAQALDAIQFGRHQSEANAKRMNGRVKQSRGSSRSL